MGDLLKICTLGGLSIQRDGQPVGGFVSRKVEALLVYLACDRREHPREVLAEMLWNDLSQDRSMANLRMALSSLQQQLAPYLIVTRQSVSLNPERDVWLDVRELEEGIEAAEQLWSRPNGKLTAPVASRLQEALGLYRGNFLAGFHLRDSRNFEDWMVMEQERLRRRTIDSLYRLASHFLEKGVYNDGIAQVNKLLQIDPLWEAAHRLLMMLLARAGQTGAAVTQFETCSQILKNELDVKPDEETVKLYTSIVNGKINTTTESSAPQYNLPMPPTPFVDRPQERKRISERLDNVECRLLTLIGAGGIGKTRLALQAAYERTADYRQGVFFVGLNAITTPDGIPSAIASALKVTLETDTPENAVLNLLHDKEMLLVLDNFEHLLDGAEFVSQILAKAPNVKILVTSRERLNIEEEWLLPVDGLSYPEKTDDRKPESYGAVQLFLQNARRVQPEFSLQGNVEAVVQICQLVEGLPLGLELSAAWLRLMPCEQIAEHIVRDLDFLKTSLRNVPERHRSIRVLFDHSWRLLSANEQAAFAKLSVFRGDFSIESGQAIAGASLPILVQLIEKSLVRVQTSGRYDVHELLRRFAYEKLVEQGLDKATHHLHWKYYYQLAREIIFDDREYELAIENTHLIGALEWAYQTRQYEELLELSGDLSFYWLHQGYLRDGRYWLGQALSVMNPTFSVEVQAKVLSGTGIIDWKLGNFDDARQYLSQALTLYRELDQKMNIAKTLNYMGYVALNTGNHIEARKRYEEILSLGYELENEVLITRGLGNLGMIASELEDWGAAQSYLEQSIQISKANGDRHSTGVLLNTLATVMLSIRDFARAKAYYEESLVICREFNDVPNIAVCIANLGEVAHTIGQFDQAYSYYHESLRMIAELGDKMMMTMMLENFACLAVDQQLPERTAFLFGAAEASRAVIGAPTMPRERKRYEGFIQRAKTLSNEQLFSTAWDRGCDIRLDEAVNLVLTGKL